MSCWYNHFWLSDLPFYFILEFCFRWHFQFRNKKEWKAIFPDLQFINLKCHLLQQTYFWQRFMVSFSLFVLIYVFMYVSNGLSVYLSVFLSVYLSIYLSIYLYVHKHSIMGPMEENPVMGKFADVFISSYQIGKHCFPNIITKNRKKSQNGFLSLRFFRYIMCW